MAVPLPPYYGQIPGAPFPSPSDLLRPSPSPVAADPAAMDTPATGVDPAADNGAGLPFRTTPDPAFRSDPYAEGGSANAFTRGFHSAVEDTIVGGKNLLGATQYGLGFKDAAQKTFADAKAEQDTAASQGPTSLDDAKKTGDWGGYVAGLAGQAVPTLATMLVPGGVIGKVGTKLAERGVARIAEDFGSQIAAKTLAEGAGAEAAEAAGKAAAASATTRLTATEGAKAAADLANRAGEVIGTTVGGLPQAEAGQTDQLANAKPEDLAAAIGKTTLGALATSAVGALPAARLLDKAGQTAVAETTQKLLPRVLKEMGAQAIVAGGAGAASTAATLATHKWVGDNVDLLSPAAFNQYLDSFIGGGIIGGITGGGLAGLKGAHMPALDMAGVGKVLKDNADKFTSRFGKPGEPVTADEAEGKTAQGGGDGGASVEEVPPEQAPNSVKAFLDTHDALKGGSAEAAQLFAKSFKHTDDEDQTLHVQNALTNALASAETPTAKQAILSELGKHAKDDVALQTDEPAPGEFQARADENLDRINQHEKIDGLIADADKSHQAFMAGADPTAGEAPRYTNPIKFDTKLQDQLAKAIPEDHPIWEYPEALKSVMESGEKMFSTGDDLTPKDNANLSVLRGLVGDQTFDKWKTLGPEFEKLTEISNRIDKESPEPEAEKGTVTAENDAHEPTQGVFEKAAADMPHDDLTDKLAAAEPGTDEHTALQSELKSRLTKDQFVKNNVGNGPSKFAEVAARPATVETVEGTQTPYGPRRTLLDLRNRISTELKKNPGDGIGAVKKVLGDLHLAGVKIKPESIKPGTWYKSKDGSEVQVSPLQAKALRGELEKPPMSAKAKEVGARKAAIEQRKADAKRQQAAAEHEPGPIERAPAKEEESFDQKAATGFERDKVAREPRQAPPGDKGGGVDDVEMHQPYDKIINDALKARGVAKSPNERAQIGHEAGVKIGTAELTKTHPENDRTLARKIAQLKDMSTGKSAEYFKRAKAGEFDSSTVRETKADESKLTGEQDKKPGEPIVDKAGRAAELRKAGAKFEGKDAERTARGEKESTMRDRPPAARADDDIEMGFKESDKPSGHQYGKETKMVNAVLDRIKFNGPKLTVRAPRPGEKVTGGRYKPGTNEVIIADHLHGPERIEVIAHEIGHHVILHELGEALEKATPELRAALLKDHAQWVKDNSNSESVVSDVYASRKAFFRGEASKGKSTGLKVSGLDPEKATYLYDMHEYLADHFARALTQKEEGQSIVEKFFSGIANKLRDAYDALFGGDRAKLAPAKSVDDWVQSLFDRNTNDVREALGQGVPKESAEKMTQAGVHAMNSGAAPNVKDFAAVEHYVNFSLLDTERGSLSRALDRQPVEAQIRAAFGHDQELMKVLEDPNRRIAMQFYLANKLFGAGKLDLKAKGFIPSEVFKRLRDGLFRIAGIAGNNEKALQLFADSRNGEIAKVRTGEMTREEAERAYDVNQKLVENSKNPPLQAAFNAATIIGRSQIFDPFRRIEYGPGSNIHYSYTSALQEIGSKLKLHTGEAGDDPGYIPAVATQKHLWNTRAGQALGNLDDKQKLAFNRLMQTRAKLTDISDPTLRVAVSKARDMFGDAYGYARKAGMKLGSLGKDYYPVAMDANEVKGRESDFRQLLDQDKFEAGMREALGGTEDSRAKMIDKLYSYASGKESLPSDGKVDPLAPPNFNAKNHRLMQFIYEHGSADDIRKFADFQNKTPDEIITPYMHGLVNRAEFARRFGDDGQFIKDKFAEAKKQGASDANIKHVEDYVASATGAYASDGSPIVRKIFGDKAGNWFGKPTTKAGISMLMAYQNIRVLPLALLSSIADPMGIGVRYGGIKSMGDLRQSWKSFKEGFQAMSKKMDKTGLQAQARAIGMADDYMVSDIMSNGMSPGLEGFARKVSDFMFKANGLNSFVKSTRYMALSAANAFLLKHAAGRDANHSLRFLQELGVNPSDIRTAEPGRVKLLSDHERSTAKPEELARDDRVRKALNRFVNEAILRTDASQHPIYMNDPAFRLVTQYKQFGHAFSDQILDRIVHETHYKNYAVLGPMMGYLPITLVGEMTRGLIQYGPGGNPNQQDWGPLDYLAFAGNRSGLLGPRVQQGLGLIEGKAYAGMGRMVELGPTGQQLEDVLHTLEGQKSVSSLGVESLPAGGLLKHW